MGWDGAIMIGSREGVMSDVYSLYYKVAGFGKVEKLFSHCSFLMYTGIDKAEKERDDGAIDDGSSVDEQGFFPIYKTWEGSWIGKFRAEMVVYTGVR